MQIDKPKWNLKIVCPHCEQGFPTFVSCPNCGYLTVQCNETGDTFLNPNNLIAGFVYICPNCNKIETNNFIIADLEEILKAGFANDKYE